MEEKRLNFNAPLLSVRRITASVAEESVPSAGKPLLRRSSLPLYSSELKSRPVGNPGVIPFIWEQTPGQPKVTALTKPPVAPKLPPGRILKENESDGSALKSQESSKIGREKVREKEEDDAFSVALETFSCAESFSMDCSTSGSADATEPSECFSKDPEVWDFMMSRFLPAAKAMATGPLQSAMKKVPSLAAPLREPQRLTERAGDGNYRRQPLPLPYKHRPNIVSKYACDQEDDESYDDDDEREDYSGTGHFSSIACGLIPRFCLKNSFLLLNPVPGMKVWNHFPPRSGPKINPRIKILDHESLGHAEDEESWEAVYTYKLGREDYPLREDGSKLTSESNWLTYWSDSQTPDGSSLYHRSTGGGISPCRNEVLLSPFHEGKGFLGVPKRELKSWKTGSFDSCDRIGENYWESALHHCKEQGSGSMSPSIDRTLYIDSVHMVKTPNSKLSSVDATANTKGMMDSADKNSEVVVDNQRMEENPTLGTSERDELQPKFSKVVEPGLSSCSDKLKFEKVNGSNFRKHGSKDGQLDLKSEEQEKNDASMSLSLLPPPLPKSPSDSWLQRTLPSVSSKNPSSQSFLGNKFQHRRQASQASSNDLKQVTDVKPFKVHPRQIRFAEVLTKPALPPALPQFET